jgi:RDD family
MNCSRCGAGITDGSTSCPRCGSVAPTSEQSPTDAEAQHEESPRAPSDSIQASPSKASPSGGPRYAFLAQSAVPRDVPASPGDISPSGGPRYAGTATQTLAPYPTQPAAVRASGPQRVTQSSRQLAPYATWWSRVGSRVLDWLVLMVPRIILVYVVLFKIDSALRGGQGSFFTEGGHFFHSLEIAFPIIDALGILYFVLLNGLGTGQTLGNRATSIAVRDATTGSPIGIARSFVRSLVRTLLYATLLIPLVVAVPIPSIFLWIPGLANDLLPLIDSRRQTIADKVAGSVVIKVAS